MPADTAQPAAPASPQLHLNVCVPWRVHGSKGTAEEADREAQAGQGRKERRHAKGAQDAGTGRGSISILLSGLKLVPNFLY